MRIRGSKRVRNTFAAVRAWPLWALPRWLVAYITALVLAETVAIVLAAGAGLGGGRGLWLFAALLGCNAATVELTRRAGENAGVIKDVHGVWELPVAILLPPVYALVMPVLRVILVQWRIRRGPAHRRVFTASVIGLSYGVTSVAFHAITGSAAGQWTSPTSGATKWMLAVAACGLLQWGINNALVMPAIKGADPTASLRNMIIGRETTQNDATELCVAVLVTFGIALTGLTIAFALPFVTLLQRSFRHGQLVNASRMDSKTGLLNAGTWEREAESEIARAVRTRSPLAVALIDLDHFKAVNDAYGHLSGDKALRAVARTLTEFVREYDLVGRFGGEEFALLLPQTRAVDAYRIAERIRAYIARLPIDVGAEPNAEPVRVTVSIGVAALGAGWEAGSGNHLTDLLAAADGALYQAKQDGRNQVCVITESTVFGQGSRAGGYLRAANGSQRADEVAVKASAGPAHSSGTGATGTARVGGPGENAPVYRDGPHAPTPGAGPDGDGRRPPGEPGAPRSLAELGRRPSGQ
jgi:diguanylate cyclase (GGDEF)-like protein